MRSIVVILFTWWAACQGDVKFCNKRTTSSEMETITMGETITITSPGYPNNRYRVSHRCTLPIAIDVHQPSVLQLDQLERLDSVSQQGSDVVCSKKYNHSLLDGNGADISVADINNSKWVDDRLCQYSVYLLNNEFTARQLMLELPEGEGNKFNITIKVLPLLTMLEDGPTTDILSTPEAFIASHPGFGKVINNSYYVETSFTLEIRPSIVSITVDFITFELGASQVCRNLSASNSADLDVFTIYGNRSVIYKCADRSNSPEHEVINSANLSVVTFTFRTKQSGTRSKGFLLKYIATNTTLPTSTSTKTYLATSPSSKTSTTFFSSTTSQSTLPTTSGTTTLKTEKPKEKFFDNKRNIAAVAGGGGLLLVIIVVLVFLLFIRNRRLETGKRGQENEAAEFSNISALGRNARGATREQPTNLYSYIDQDGTELPETSSVFRETELGEVYSEVDIKNMLSTPPNSPNATSNYYNMLEEFDTLQGHSTNNSIGAAQPQGQPDSCTPKETGSHSTDNYQTIDISGQGQLPSPTSHHYSVLDNSVQSDNSMKQVTGSHSTDNVYQTINTQGQGQSPSLTFHHYSVLDISMYNETG